MRRQPITPAEWAIAHQKLDRAASGTKLPFSMKLTTSGPVFRPGFTQTYQTLHSFINIDGTIYALYQGKDKDAVLGSGQEGTVKYGESEDGKRVVVKIEKTPGYRLRQSLRVLRELSYLRGHAQRIGSNKSYTVMEDLGESLFDVLQQNTLTEAERWDIGIKLCWRVHQLHTGALSTDKIAYAHLDIKPANIVRDARKKIHLVDFSFSDSYPEDKWIIVSGSPGYLLEERDITTGKFTKLKLDMLALKRTLFMPNRVHFLYGYNPKMREAPDLPFILTDDMMDKHQLHDYISTHSADYQHPFALENDTMTAVTVCAILISASTGLGIDAIDIKRNNELALVIATLYHQGKSPEEIRIVCRDPSMRRLVAALSALNMLSEETLSDHQHDAAFLQVLYQCQSHEMACALVCLRKENLSEFYARLLDSPSLVSALLALVRDTTTWLIPHVVNNMELAKGVVFLHARFLHGNYKDLLFTHRTDCPLGEQFYTCYLWAMRSVVNGGYDEDVLYNEKYYFENPEFCQAVRKASSPAAVFALMILHKHGHLSKFFGDVISSADVARIVCSLDEALVGSHYHAFHRIINQLLSNVNFREIAKFLLENYAKKYDMYVCLDQLLTNSIAPTISAYIADVSVDQAAKLAVVVAALNYATLCGKESQANTDVTQLLKNSRRLSLMVARAKSEKEIKDAMKLEEALVKIENKKLKFEKEEMDAAAQACVVILQGVDALVESFFAEKKSGLMNWKFLSACSDIIKGARGTLETHRGFLGAVDYCLPFMRKDNLTYNFFRPDTGDVLDEVDEALNQFYQKDF